MKQLCFLAFFIVNQLSIQAQSLDDKYIGTWVDNTPSKGIGLSKSIFFLGKNNEYIWTNINDEKVWTMATTFSTMIGNYELNNDTLTINIKRTLSYSTNARVNYNDSLNHYQKKYIISKNSLNKVVLEPFPDLRDTLYALRNNKLEKKQDLVDTQTTNSCIRCKYYEKADYDYLKTECCKFTLWEDLINFVCK